MNVDKPRNTTSGCTHQLSARCVCPKPTRDNGTSIWDIKPPHAIPLFHLLSSASLIAIEYGDSHNTGKFIAIVFGNYASSKRLSNFNPNARTPLAINSGGSVLW
jgi:hypothetical protein